MNLLNLILSRLLHNCVVKRGIMRQFPDCPECKQTLIKSESSVQPSTIASVRCTECEFEDDIWEKWDEGHYDYMFLGKKKEVAA